SAPTLALDALGTGNDTTPQISGNTDAAEGSTVAITVTDSAGNTENLSATVDINGNFTVSPVTALAEGDYTVSASTTDAAGNTATTSQTGNIDTSAPTLVLDVLGTGNDTTPQISGNTDAAQGSTVAITVTDSAGNTESLSATVDINGNFTVSPVTALAEGDYTVSASTTDAAGNTATTSQTGILDTTPPVLQLTAQGTTGDNTPTIAGTTDLAENSIISLQVTDSAGSTQNFDATVARDGSFSADVPLPIADGNYTVVAKGQDIAGNQTTVSDNSGNVNTSAPLINLEVIGDTGDTTPLIEGTTSVGVGFTVTITVTDLLGTTQTLYASVNANGEFSVVVPNPLVEGTFTVHAQVTDGSTSDALITGRVDLQPPALSLDAVELANTTPLISGMSDEIGATVNITVTDAQGGKHVLTATVQSDGTFSVTPPPLPQGNITVSAQVVDSAGNIATASVDGLIDIIAPTLTLNDLALNSPTPLISGSSDTSDALVTVTITDRAGNSQSLSAVTDIDGNFVVTPAALAEGEIAIEVTIEDGSGNVTLNSLNAIIDLTPPSLAVELNQLDSNTPMITGNSDEIGAMVSLTVTDALGQSQVLSAQVDTSGAFSVVPAAVAEGQLTVTATVADDAGNISAANVTGLIDITIPTLTLDAIGLINDATPTISGTTDEVNGLVEIVVTDADNIVQTLSVLANDVGDFVLDIPVSVAQGLLAIEASVSDAAGNTINAVTDATIDTIAPALEITSMPTLLSPVVTGFTDPSEAGRSLDITVTANILGIETTLNINTTILADGSWSSGPIADLSAGPVSATIAIIDEAGNFVSVSESTTTSGTNSGAEANIVSGDLVSLNLLGGATTLDI
uniref:beta strand repeat-containing protein n=1 Tax=Alteromonas lipotrueiana TaxID=2803815 RepID=UPI001C4644C2